MKRLQTEREQGNGMSLADENPAGAPRGSKWASARKADFFLPPALSLDVLNYLSLNGGGPAEAIRERFGLPEQSNHNGGAPSAEASEKVAEGSEKPSGIEESSGRS